jgi:hypothetical protein
VGYFSSAEIGVHRFVHGQAGLSLAMIDRLAEVLDLHVSVGKGG